MRVYTSIVCVCTYHRTQSRSAATFSEPCLREGSRFAAFVSPSGKLLALTVKKPAGQTPSVGRATARISPGGGSHAG